MAGPAGNPLRRLPYDQDTYGLPAEQTVAALGTAVAVPGQGAEWAGLAPARMRLATHGSPREKFAQGSVPASAPELVTSGP